MRKEGFLLVLGVVLMSPMGLCRAEPFWDNGVWTENFNQYVIGDGSPTCNGHNWDGDGIWGITGFVDLHGTDGTYTWEGLIAGFMYDGVFVDLDGSSYGEHYGPEPQNTQENVARMTLETALQVSYGLWFVSFDLAGNHRNEGDDTVVFATIQGDTYDILVPHDQDWQTYTYTVNVADGRLNFVLGQPVNDAGDLSTGYDNDWQGPLLDNITVRPVPEPTGFLLLGLGGLAWLRRRRTL